MSRERNINCNCQRCKNCTNKAIGMIKSGYYRSKCYTCKDGRCRCRICGQVRKKNEEKSIPRCKCVKTEYRKREREKNILIITESEQSSSPLTNCSARSSDGSLELTESNLSLTTKENTAITVLVNKFNTQSILYNMYCTQFNF